MPDTLPPLAVHRIPERMASLPNWGVIVPDLALSPDAPEVKAPRSPLRPATLLSTLDARGWLDLARASAAANALRAEGRRAYLSFRIDPDCGIVCADFDDPTKPPKPGRPARAVDWAARWDAEAELDGLGWRETSSSGRGYHVWLEAPEHALTGAVPGARIDLIGWGRQVVVTCDEFAGGSGHLDPMPAALAGRHRLDTRKASEFAWADPLPLDELRARVAALPTIGEGEGRYLEWLSRLWAIKDAARDEDADTAEALAWEWTTRDGAGNPSGRAWANGYHWRGHENRSGSAMLTNLTEKHVPQREFGKALALPAPAAEPAAERAFGAALKLPPQAETAPEPNPVDLPPTFWVDELIANIGKVGGILPRRWCVERTLPRRGLATLFGPSGSGKSTWALDLLMALASDRPEWLDGRRIAPGCGALLVPFEGEDGLAARAAGVAAQHGGEAGRVALVYRPPQIRDDEFPLVMSQAIIKMRAERGVTGTVVVLIDTLAQATVGVDENSARDVGEVMKVLKDLTEQDGLGDVLVLIVHHSGKEVDKGARGSTAITAAADAVLSAYVPAQITDSGKTRQDGQGANLHGETGVLLAVKLKDMAGAGLKVHCAFEARAIPGLYEEALEGGRGDPVTSLLLRPAQAAPAAKTAGKVKGDSAAADATAALGEAKARRAAMAEDIARGLRNEFAESGPIAEGEPIDGARLVAVFKGIRDFRGRYGNAAETAIQNGYVRLDPGETREPPPGATWRQEDVKAFRWVIGRVPPRPTDAGDAQHDPG